MTKPKPKEKTIIKRLVEREFDCKVVIVATAGSYAHGLATDNSDVDYIVFAEPTPQMLYERKWINGEFKHLFDGAFHEGKVKDIRDFIPLMAKSNPNFLDVFNDPDIYVDSSYSWLFDDYHSYFLKSYDPVRLAKSAIGMANQYLKHNPGDKAFANVMYLTNLAYYAAVSHSFPNRMAMNFTDAMFKKDKDKYPCVLFGRETIKKVVNDDFESSYDKDFVCDVEEMKHNLNNLHSFVNEQIEEVGEPDEEGMKVIEEKMRDIVMDHALREFFNEEVAKWK